MKLATVLIGAATAFNNNDAERYAELRPQYFGQAAALSVTPAAVNKCCNNLVVWTEDVYFPGQFQLSENLYNDLPVYEARANNGPLMVFYSATQNRWVISDELSEKNGFRAIGDNTKCPGDSSWKVFSGEEFSNVDLENERIPYIVPDRMMECLPDSFDIEYYKQSLIDQMCGLIGRGKGHARSCHKVSRAVQLVFGDWEGSIDSHIRELDQIQVPYLVTIDQWYQTLVSVLLRRTFFTPSDVQKSVRQTVQSIVSDLSHTYSQRNFAKKDSRFEFLWI